MRKAFACMVFAMLASRPALSGTLEVTIAGLPPELEAAVRARLTLIQYLKREVSAPQVTLLLSRSDDQIQEALEPFGYYDSKITHQLEKRPDLFRASFQIAPGPPVIVSDSHVTVSADCAGIPAIAKALEAFRPRRGFVLDHGEYESSKTAVTTALTSSGYLKSRSVRHRVEVTTARHSASIDLTWECGARYRFGPVHFPAVPLSDDLLHRMVPWTLNDFYSSAKLIELQQRLTEADYFATAAVRLRMDQAQDEIIPIDVELTPARRNVYDGSIYFSTDTGPGTKFAYRRRWLNSYGHKLEFNGDYAERIQEATLNYRMPYAGRNARSLNLAATYRDETTDSSQESSAKIVFNETRQWHGFTRTLGLQLLDGDFEIGSERGSSTELFALASIVRTHSDDPAFPRKGYSLTTGVRLAPVGWLSSTRFAQIGARAKWIRSAGEQARVILRSDLAAMTVKDFDRLPPDLRFFAGGDRSIRGFDYQAIGSRNDAGDVIGGTALAVASAEYERYFGNKWGAAVFVDAGDVFLGTKFEWNVGTGIGARWKSPVGVVRLDVAIPVETQLEKSLRVHVTIGPDL